MSKSINFVGDKRKKLTKVQAQDKKIMTIMIYILVGVFAVFLIVVGLRLFYVYRVKTVNDEQVEVKSAILSKESIEKEYIIFAQKLKKLSVLFGKRKNKQEALVFFSEIFGEDVIVSGIDYSSADEDVVTFTIKTPDVFVMEKVFDILQSEDVTNEYPQISKSSMRRAQSGNYTINLAVILTNEPAKELPEDVPTTDNLIDQI